MSRVIKREEIIKVTIDLDSKEIVVEICNDFINKGWKVTAYTAYYEKDEQNYWDLGYVDLEKDAENFQRSIVDGIMKEGEGYLNGLL